MANALGPLSAIGYVQQQGELGRQRGQENRLNALAGQSYSATTPEAQTSLLSQMAQINPAAAQAQQGQFQTQQDRTQKELYGLAQGWKTVPQQYRQSYYEKFLSPRLSALGMGEQPGFDEATIDGAADQIIAAFGTQGAGSGVQSTYINRAGQRVAIMRDGSQQVLGEADARTQLRDQQGVAPSIIDLRTGTATPLQSGQIQAQGANGAYTIDPSLPPEVQAQIRAAESAGRSFDGGALTAMRPDNSQQITPYQQAQLVRQDRADARADMAAMDARDARSQASEARQVAAQQKAQQAQQAINTRAAQLSDVQRGVQRVEAALNALDQSRVGTGPIAQGAQRYLPAGQELETAVNAMNNSMLALTRVPGMGAQSDLEARIAGMRFPQLDREEGVNRRTLQDLKSFVADLSRTARQSDAADRNAIQTSTVVVDGPAGRSVTRRGRTPDGRTVVQYSDGTIEYGN